MNILTVLALILNFLGFLFMALSCGGDSWLKSKHHKSGLWEYCSIYNDESKCESHDFDKYEASGLDYDFIKAVRAFGILGILASIAAFVMCLVTLFSKIRCLYAAIPCFVAAFCQMIAMAVYTKEIKEHKGNLGWGWSFGIGWAAIFYPLVAGITMVLNKNN